MKILSLNKKQEKLLMQMLREFFPEYSYSINRIPYGLVNFGNGINKNPVLITHWFQLCLTELPIRIFNKLNKLATERHSLYIKPVTLSEIKETALFSKHPVEELDRLIKLYKSYKWFKLN